MMLGAIVTAASLLWRTHLAYANLNVAAVYGGVVVAATPRETVALDLRNGRVRWSVRNETFVQRGNRWVYLRSGGGTLYARAVETGALVWSAHPCDSSSGQTSFSALETGGGLLVGCRNTIVRLSVSSGQVLGRRDVFETDGPIGIAAAGQCVENLTGSRDGAMIVDEEELVDCRSLRSITPPQSEAAYLGRSGARRVFARFCWIGCDGNDPIEIRVYDPGSGRSSQQFSVEHGTPFLAGADVCVGAKPRIDCYSLAAPHRRRTVVDDTALDPMPLRDGAVLIHSSSGGSNITRIVDFSARPYRTLFQGALPGEPVSTFWETDPDLVAVSARGSSLVYVRLSDGAAVSIPSGAIAGDGHVAVLVEPPGPGEAFVRIAAYRLPSSSS